MENLTKESIEILLRENNFEKYKTAKKIGTTYITLQKYIEKFGIIIPTKLDEKEIIRLYCEEQKSTIEIAKIVNSTANTIRRLLRRNNITIRKRNKTTFKKGQKAWNKTTIKNEQIEELCRMFNNSVSIKLIAKKLNVSEKEVNRKVKELGLVRKKSMMSREQYDNSNDEKIIKLYIQGKSSTEIGKLLGINHRTVLSHLKHCNVKRRSLSDSQYNYNKKERPKDFDSYEKMYDLYIVNRLSKKDIAIIYNSDGGTIDRVLKKLGIKVRGVSESKIGVFVGSKHPNWKGGRSGLYMRLREYFRFYQARKALKRDGNKCQMCGSKKKLQAHHIRPFKEIFDEILSEHKDLDIQKDQEKLFEIMTNDSRMNDIDNLITYCKECHLFKVHGYKHKEEK